MEMGEGLAHESIERRRQRRLPLRRKFSALPNRGLVGGAICLLLPIVFFMVTQHDPARGIYVGLVTRRHSGPDEICLEGPIVLTINQHGSVSKLLLNGTEVSREEFRADGTAAQKDQDPPGRGSPCAATHLSDRGRGSTRIRSRCST
jgi:hypothetical protein